MYAPALTVLACIDTSHHSYLLRGQKVRPTSSSPSTLFFAANLASLGSTGGQTHPRIRRECFSLLCIINVSHGLQLMAETGRWKTRRQAQRCRRLELQIPSNERPITTFEHLVFPYTDHFKSPDDSFG